MNIITGDTLGYSSSKAALAGAHTNNKVNVSPWAGVERSIDSSNSLGTSSSKPRLNQKFQRIRSKEMLVTEKSKKDILA